jgi:UDP-N-acetylmuramoyl-tripeptide--D-alanyl-D-alanine ligase
MKKGKKTLTIKAGLLGRHQVAPVAFGAALSDAMGLSKTQIESGCSHIAPFEHRMQPRHVSGAWIIDDTYNGNLEGLQAGLKLLDELDFKRKWYVTPGLVDQGFETEHVHIELGKAIAETDTDIVVLMENSARPIIEKSMKKHGFKGELRVEEHPLDFYLNIEHVSAAGDIVLMQNDWTDNYN